MSSEVSNKNFNDYYQSVKNILFNSASIKDGKFVKNKYILIAANEKNELLNVTSTNSPILYALAKVEYSALYGVRLGTFTASGEEAENIIKENFKNKIKSAKDSISTELEIMGKTLGKTSKDVSSKKTELENDVGALIDGVNEVFKNCIDKESLFKGT